MGQVGQISWDRHRDASAGDAKFLIWKGFNFVYFFSLILVSFRGVCHSYAGTKVSFHTLARNGKVNDFFFVIFWSF